MEIIRNMEFIKTEDNISDIRSYIETKSHFNSETLSSDFKFVNFGGVFYTCEGLACRYIEKRETYKTLRDALTKHKNLFKRTFDNGFFTTVKAVDQDGNKYKKVPVLENLIEAYFVNPDIDNWSYSYIKLVFIKRINKVKNANFSCQRG